MAFKNKTSKFNKCPNKNLAFSTIQLYINLDPRREEFNNEPDNAYKMNVSVNHFLLSKNHNNKSHLARAKTKFSMKNLHLHGFFG